MVFQKFMLFKKKNFILFLFFVFTYSQDVWSSLNDQEEEFSSLVPNDVLVYIFDYVDEETFFNGVKLVSIDWLQLTNTPQFKLPDLLTEEFLEYLPQKELMIRTKNTKDGILKIANLCFSDPLWISKRFSQEFLRFHTKTLSVLEEDLESLDSSEIVSQNTLEKGFPILKLMALSGEKDQLSTIEKRIFKKFSFYKEPKPLSYYRISGLSGHKTSVYQLLNKCCETDDLLGLNWQKRIMNSDSLLWKVTLARVYIKFNHFKEMADFLLPKFINECSFPNKMDLADVYFKHGYVEDAGFLYEEVLNDSSCPIRIKGRAAPYLLQIGREEEANRLSSGAKSSTVSLLSGIFNNYH